MFRIHAVCLSLVFVACAAGEEDPDVVTSQETTVARCPSTSPDAERTEPADPVNQNPSNTGPERPDVGSEEDLQPGCDPGKNASGGYGSRGAAEAARSGSSSSGSTGNGTGSAGGTGG